MKTIRKLSYTDIACVLFPFSVKPWLLQLLFKTGSFKGRTCCRTTVWGGRGSTEPAEELPEGLPPPPSLRAAGSSWPHPGGWEGDGKGCLLFRMKASRSTPHIHGASWLDVGVVRSREGLPDGQAVGWRGGSARDSAARPAPQALLSSTFTARGLMAPVRFIWEAAKGASCRVTAPRPGFSSTRGFAFGKMNGTTQLHSHGSRRWLHRHPPPSCS